MNDEKRSVSELLHEVHERVRHRTFIQDLREPGTDRLDRSRVAAKFNNLEHAVDELAEAVELIADRDKTA